MRVMLRLLLLIVASYPSFAASPQAESVEREIRQICGAPGDQSLHWKSVRSADGSVTLSIPAAPNGAIRISGQEWEGIQRALSTAHLDPSSVGYNRCVNGISSVLLSKVPGSGWVAAAPKHDYPAAAAADGGYFPPRDAAPPPAAAAEAPHPAKAAPAKARKDDPEYAVVRVFYATDRAAIHGAKPAAFYGSDRAPEVNDVRHIDYGECDVSIPRDHRMGELEAPSIWKLEFRQNPKKHVVLMAVTPAVDAQSYFASLKERVANSKESSAFIFVHGYNVTFEDAARRTAQMHYDLGFDGAPIFFSWPARGEAAAYERDETNVEWATPDLMHFLQDVLARSEVKNLYLIAHSMGNRALVGAFQQLVAMNGEARSRIREVILAAPDLDADVFREQIVPVLVGSGAAETHVTLYASSKDRALEASKKFHGYFRAGDSNHIVLAAGLESIDATALDTSLIGHSYYADNRSVLSDIFSLLRDHIRACRRFGLKQRQGAAGTYCVLEP